MISYKYKSYSFIHDQYQYIDSRVINFQIDCQFLNKLYST